MLSNGLSCAQDTIVALASARGEGALAIFRISGPNCLEQVRSLLVQQRTFDTTAPRTIALYTVCNPENGNIVDTVTAITYREPRSYTGENMVEMLSHGGEIVRDSLLSLFLRSGMRLAQRGEFSLRGYLNGKCSVLEAEAVNQIVQGKTASMVTSAFAVYGGGLTQFGAEVREQILRVCAKLETRIEFGEDHDVDEGDKGEQIQSLMQIRETLEKELEKRKRVIKDEAQLRIALAGTVNAGKSTLFNVLLETQRALVHAKGGTTRDYLSERIVFHGKTLEILDTAGYRTAEDELEQEGIRRGQEVTRQADGIIIVATVEERDDTVGNYIQQYEGKHRAVVINKTDLGSAQKTIALMKEKEIPVCAVSLLEEKGRESARVFIKEWIRDTFNRCDASTLLITRRQELAARSLYHALETVVENYDDGEEMSIYRLQEALESTDILLGKIDNETVMDEVFSNFCIGK